MNVTCPNCLEELKLRTDNRGTQRGHPGTSVMNEFHPDTVCFMAHCANCDEKLKLYMEYKEVELW